jgi:hypothetical protein
MSNKVKFTIVFAIIGLVVGYLIFGRYGTGDFISLKQLFSFSGGDFGSFGRKIGGVKAIQQKVFLSGGVGAIAGFVFAYLKKK